jgi:hypothetical protein
VWTDASEEALADPCQSIDMICTLWTKTSKEPVVVSQRLAQGLGLQSYHVWHMSY